MTSTPRKPKRMLTAEQKYDLWLRMLTGQISQADAAAEAGVDRSVITRLRAVARDGAIAALQASRPGRPRQSRQEASEAAALRAEVDEVRGECPGSELDRRVVCRYSPVVQEVPREAADELFQFVAAHYGNLRLGGNAERIERLHSTPTGARLTPSTGIPPSPTLTRSASEPRSTISPDP